MRHRLIAAAVAGVLLAAGCGSDAKPAKNDLVAKLSADSELAGVKDAVGAAKYSVFISCVSDYLLSEGKAADLTEYVKGKRTIDDIRVPQSQNPTAAVAKCQATAGIPDATSAPAS